MQFNTLNNKKLVDGKFKFTRPTLVFLDTNETINEHIVTEDQVGRIDLISLLYSWKDPISRHTAQNLTTHVWISNTYPNQIWNLLKEKSLIKVS